MTRVRELELYKQCYILIGVGPLVSARTANWMRNNVPDVHISDAIIKRLEGVDDQRREGNNCVPA